MCVIWLELWYLMDGFWCGVFCVLGMCGVFAGDVLRDVRG